jgi:predicted HTH transcriptional regulator
MAVNKLRESSVCNPEQLKKLKKLVAGGEGQTVEFKRKATHPEKIVREMIAFANTRGGLLLVGIGDDKTIPGLKFPEDESHVIKKALQNCYPPLSFNEVFISLGESRTVIQYEIPESKTKPHRLILPERISECFVRVDDRSIKASREVREIIKRSQHKKDIRFHYGEFETVLMKYLDENTSVTLKKFMEVAGLNRNRASKKLVLLVLADVLKVSPHEKGDVYELGFNPSKDVR